MASAQVNGYRPAVAEQHEQAAFYDQWLQLKEAVLADKHARFRLPAAVRQRLQSAVAPSSTSNYASTLQLPGLSNAQSREQAMLNSSQGAATAFLGNAQAFSQNASTASGTVAPRSGIDPVLLTKSEDLIRAEIQLKRQRIERQLKDAAEQRRHTPFFKNQEDMAPLIGLVETFEKALELVRPISGLKPPANAQTTASDSFDENSYYSSQANDWSSEEGSPNKRSEATGLASSAPPSKQHPVHVEHDDKQHRPLHNLDQHESETLYDAEREDSEEYSPPDANAFSGPDADADAMDLDDGKYTPMWVSPCVPLLSNGADSSEFVPQDANVPSPQATVITNHLSQVAAPQPARVSPHTLAKPPGLTQSQTSYPSAANTQLPASPHAYQSSSAYRQHFESDDSTTSPRNSTQTSPVGAFKKQRGKGKKRKREADREAKEARKNRPKPSAPSPEPYIKPEPVSPQPFAAPPALQPSRTRPYQLPPDVEVVSGPRAYYHEPPPHPPNMHYGMDGVSSPTVIRVSSPSVYARPRRDDQDLRRVASLHAAHRPVSPTARAASPAGYRTVSQPFPERGARYGEEVMRTPQVQYVRSERSVTPPHLRAAREGPASMMAPPPPPARRIVVDQYGNRYYANEPETQPRMSVAPQLRPESELMYERAPSRQPVAYASQLALNAYEDEHGMRMPPPPPPVRRVVEQAEIAPIDYRTYRQREYSRAPEPQYYREEPAGPIYVRDAPGPRASVYPPESAPAGVYAPRAYSVRPEMEPVRYMSRQPSMAPQGDYARVAEIGGRAATMAPPPAPMRAVSVVPGSEYGRPVEMRYSYGSQGAGPYAAPGPRYGEEAREIYVDQYGREVRRVGY
ncbi:hypothetical protein KCU85_g1636, partial [Aureobasidium melanogenum]